MAYRITPDVLSQLKSLAELLPLASTNIPVARGVVGQALENAGRHFVGEKPVRSHKNYVAPLDKFQSVNHLKKLKKAYLSNGEAGVRAYAAKYQTN